MLLRRRVRWPCPRIACPSLGTSLPHGTPDLLAVLISDESLGLLLRVRQALRGLGRSEHRIRQVLVIDLAVELQAVHCELLLSLQVLQVIHILRASLFDGTALWTVLFVVVDIAFDFDVLIGHVVQVGLLLRTLRDVARRGELLGLLLFIILHLLTYNNYILTN